jgi:hypothetical protein
MRLRRRTSLVLVALTVLAAHPAAASQPKRSASEFREIHPRRLGDGVYTIANRSVVCRVRGEAAACMTRWVVIICRDYVCHPKKDGEVKPAEQLVKWDDIKGPNVRLLKPHRYVSMGQLDCDVGRNYVDCNLGDALGRFQLGDSFARNINWDETPSNYWPWNGKRYKGANTEFHQSDSPP